MNNNIPHLNAEQKTAVSHINGPMMVVAGPGSGKTFLLIERIVNLISSGIPAEKILVITFSKKAALEMQNRFKNRTKGENFDVTFGTFHAVFFHILQFYGLYDTNSILKKTEKLKLIETAGISLKIQKAYTKAWQEDMLEKITCYKNTGDAIFSLNSGLFFNEEDKQEFINVSEKYSILCQNEKKLDFDDMVTNCLKLFKENTSVRHQWQEKYKYILVDEFQDINPAQYEMLKLLEGNYHNIFVVGDDDQSIYGFRGASPGIMQIFLQDHMNCKTVILKLNYRCCYQVVEAADICIRNNKQRLSRDRQQTLKNRKPGKVIINVSDNEELEADYIVSEIQKLCKNPVGDIAIIYRSEHCVSLIEEKIKSNGFRYDKKSPGISFYDLEPVKIVLSYIRIAAGKSSLDDILRIINHPERKITRDAIVHTGDNCDDVLKKAIEYYENELLLPKYDERIKNLIKLYNDIAMIRELPPEAAYIYILKGIGLEKDISANYKKAAAYPLSLQEILNELRSRLSAFKTIWGFVEYVDNICEKIELNAAEDDGHDLEKSSQKIHITFITAHASKGLEYPVVFIAGLQEGLFPHRKNLNEPGIEEERRLFYVAATRAKERLYLCGRGSEHGKKPSRFIREVMKAQSFIASNSTSSRNSSNASATASYSSSSSIKPSSGSTLGLFSSSE